MKKFFEEFKTFAFKGNIMDMAIGVIIGAAFQAIVASLTNDIISPIIGLFANKDFSGLVLTIGDVNIKYGAFITAIINFLIMALVIFMFLKMINKLLAFNKKETEAKEEIAPTTKKCTYCMSEIHIDATKCPHCTSDL